MLMPHHLIIGLTFDRLLLFLYSFVLRMLSTSINTSAILSQSMLFMWTVLSSATAPRGLESTFGPLQPDTNRRTETTLVPATAHSAPSRPVSLATTTTARAATLEQTRTGTQRIVCGTARTAELTPALAAHGVACHSSPRP